MEVEEQEEVRDAEAGEDQDTVDVENLDDDELDKMIEGEAEEENDEDAGSEDDSEVAGDETDEGDEGKEEEPPESEVDVLRRQLQEKESFIQRQANEIGELRKNPPLEDETVPREEEIGEDAYFDNPREAIVKTVDRILA